MKRKFLREQGLSEEQVEAIMAKYGEKKKAYLDKIEELENGTEDLETIKAERDKLQKLAEKVPELERKLEETTNELNGRDMKYALKSALENKTHDFKYLTSLLDVEKLSLNEDGTIEGLDEQIEPLKEQKHYLFIEEAKEEVVEDEIEKENVNPQFTIGGNPKIQKTEESTLDAKLKAYKERFKKGD